MVPAEFLQQCGLFVARGFLSPDECRDLVARVALSPHARATVSQDGHDVHDDTQRATHQIAVPADLKHHIQTRLAALQPDLQRHFALSLSRCQTPNFLAYSVGDFYLPHVDAADDPDAADQVGARKISAVVFLNSMSETDTPDSFDGGALTFYDLLDDPALRDRGFPLRAEAGLLIAFPARMKHEVQKVTRGMRYTVVSWFS